MKYGKQFWVEELGEKWALQLKDTLKSPYATKLMDYISVQYAMNDIRPARKNVFKAFRACPWDSLKVVILGTEPSIASTANGLAFGDTYTSQFHSTSLTTIFDCVEREYYIEDRRLNLDFDFSLEDWAKQGVLLLNRNLTSKKNVPRCYQKQWGTFNSAVLNAINEYKPGTIFILWGKEAQALEPHIKKTNYVLKFDEPGKYADKGKDWHCPNFKEANDILLKLNNEQIKW